MPHGNSIIPCGLVERQVGYPAGIHHVTISLEQSGSRCNSTVRGGAFAELHKDPIHDRIGTGLGQQRGCGLFTAATHMRETKPAVRLKRKGTKPPTRRASDIRGPVPYAPPGRPVAQLKYPR